MMKLYKVTYMVWNMTCSDLIQRQMFSVGRDEEEAIANAKAEAESDARDYRAIEMSEVMGHKIVVR